MYSKTPSQVLHGADSGRTWQSDVTAAPDEHAARRKQHAAPIPSRRCTVSGYEQRGRAAGTNTSTAGRRGYTAGSDAMIASSRLPTPDPTASRSFAAPPDVALARDDSAGPACAAGCWAESPAPGHRTALGNDAPPSVFIRTRGEQTTCSWSSHDEQLPSRRCSVRAASPQTIGRRGCTHPPPASSLHGGICSCRRRVRTACSPYSDSSPVPQAGPAASRSFAAPLEVGRCMLRGGTQDTYVLVPVSTLPSQSSGCNWTAQDEARRTSAVSVDLRASPRRADRLLPKRDHRAVGSMHAGA
ncbi:hypothetical protein K466DRAFT_7807 [Polyporus arcularius HHB13444]|uniref:Uncharacterized protein n=1 Tax=Polyporus arcularius HHB13444 TaxID=1314778 RepID=A0A5C3NQ24_9APHY|nr:hypothetical protein K466DRAFT_7807 [Polyporus arcularius HHB13444]